MSDDAVSMCAVIQATNESHIGAIVKDYYPDAELRFCDEKPDGYQPPSDRFPLWPSHPNAASPSPSATCP